MAQVDIGKIKIVWKGPWNSGTAYTVDDAVSHTAAQAIFVSRLEQIKTHLQQLLTGSKWLAKVQMQI